MPSCFGGKQSGMTSLHLTYWDGVCMQNFPCLAFERKLPELEWSHNYTPIISRKIIQFCRYYIQIISIILIDNSANRWYYHKVQAAIY